MPLVVRTGPVNQRDDGKLEEMLEAFPVLADGDWRKAVHTQPRELSGDRGYGFPYSIALLLLFGVISKLSPRGKKYPRGSGLVKERYVVERTSSWWTHFRRLNLCYECRGEHFQGLHVLAAAIICSNTLRKARSGNQSHAP